MGKKTTDWKDPAGRAKRISKAHTGMKKPWLIGNTNGFKKGVSSWNKGLSKSKETIEKIRLSLMGNKNALGKHWKIKDTSNMMGHSLGEKSACWIKDRSKVVGRQERNNPVYKHWVRQVKKRDGNICQLKDDNCSGYNIVHHIKGWKQYPELRYNINNGITLCQAHHPRTRAEEKRLIPILEELASVSNE